MILCGFYLLLSSREGKIRAYYAVGDDHEQALGLARYVRRNDAVTVKALAIR